ncbi:MAG: glycosyltransferase family 4 protein [Candidatus Daviesbacteria bacterium]|nr:glycosyltransferase family 4 protein [Candidatus Daviesbacteria bacterium]
MNILIFSWRGPGHPHAGGAEQATHEYAKGWIKAGHRVTLFTSDYPGCKPLEVIDGVIIIRRGSQILGVHLKAFFWYITERKEKFDLVIDQFHGIPFFTPLFVRVKKLAFIHEVTKEIWRLNPLSFPFNLIPTIIGTFLEPFIFKFFYKNIPFMTGSNSTKKDLINWGIEEDKITIIPYGLDKSPLGKILTKEKKLTLIFLGALAKDKGVEEGLKAFALINSKKKGVKFWIVGKGEEHYTNYLKIKSKELGLEKNIEFYGYVDKNKKYQLLAKAHILINPSFREGWSLVVMEAASVGTPTVGYDVPGLRDSIINNETGILSANNPESLARKALELMADTIEYEKLRKNCLKWSSQFNWEKSAGLSLKLIEKIVNI